MDVAGRPALTDCLADELRFTRLMLYCKKTIRKEKCLFYKSLSEMSIGMYN